MGDLLRYDVDTVEVTFDEGSDGSIQERSRNVTWTTIVAAEGPSRATDRFGIERDTLAFRMDKLEGDELLASERCHALMGGVQAVRRDHLAGGQASSFGWESTDLGQVGPVALMSSRTDRATFPLVTFDSSSCFGHNLLAGRTFREGDTATLHELIPEATGESGPTTSRPALETTFHGRPALSFIFDGIEKEDDSLELLVADGLPGIAKIQEISDAPRPFLLKLTGFEAGQGDPLPPLTDAVLPDVDPAAPLRPFDPLVLPTRQYDLDYPYEDAYARLLADPTTGLREFLASHPNAYLHMAAYEVTEEDASGVPRSTASWFVTYADGDEGHSAFTQRRVVGGLDAAAVHTAQGWYGSFVREDEPSLPKQIPDPALLPSKAAAFGVPTSDISSMSYFVYAHPGGTNAALALSTASMQEFEEGTSIGRDVQFDAFTGAAQFVGTTMTTTTSGGVLRPPSGSSLEASEGTALAALAGPGVGAGLGVGAATGVALLVVAVKFLLFPLFTRLVRARLLDNPVRARLYERVRSEPGIHQADLVDFLGIGEGATRHHLKQLVSHRYVAEVRDGGFLRYFAAGEVPPDVARREIALRPATARAVFEVYAADPRLPLRAAAAKLRMSAPSVHRHRAKLEKAGLLAPRR